MLNQKLLIVLVIVLLLFGRGKIPQLMGDMAKGIKSFKRGMSDEEKKEDVERLKKIQLELHSDFIKVVEDSRSNKLKKDDNPDLFTGEFWSGSTAKKLGLIDGIGNAEEIIREKFGEDVTIKKFEKPKSWLNKKLSGASESQIENLINILEEKSIWQRYGF